MIYIFGGGGYGTYSDLVQIHNPQKSVWGVASPMPTPRLGLAVVVVDSEISALGGVAYGGAYGTLLSTNERYTQLEAGSSLPTPTPTPTSSPKPTSTPTSSPLPKPEPFPTTLVSVTFVTVATAVGVGLLVYFKKRRAKSGDKP